MKSILYYVHDPMCSWCWGFDQTLTDLLGSLPENVEIIRLLGGLAPDSNQAMSLVMQEQIKNNWLRIEDTIPGVKFNFEFWKNNIARRSTYPACRAVIAARQQGQEHELAMTKAIQRAYYQEARNPSDTITLLELADEIGLNVLYFEKDLSSTKVDNELQYELDFSRALFVESYPSLVLKVENENFLISINYTNSEEMLDKIKSLI